MKKTFLLITSLFMLSFNAQEKVTIFYDSFESYQDFSFQNIGDWTLIDIDKEGQMGITGVSFPNNDTTPFAAKIINRRAIIPNISEANIPNVRNYDAKTGEKVIGMFAALLPPNNDWLISPKIKLNESNNEWRFSAKAANYTTKYEKFQILISTTDTNPASFTELPQVYTGDYFTANVWTDFVVNLDNYKNKEVYLAIRYISRIYDNPQFPPHLQKRAVTLLIDDFQVTSDALLSTAQNTISDKITFYPNPVKDILTIKSQKEINKVLFYSFTGQLLKTELFTGNSINTSALSTGHYVVKVIFNDGTEQTSKIIKK